jgi:hypothetical protein
MTSRTDAPRQAEKLMYDAAQSYLNTLKKDCCKAQAIVDTHSQAFKTVMTNSSRFNKLLHDHETEELLKEPLYSELQALQKKDEAARRILARGVSNVELKLMTLKMECNTLELHINLLEQRSK